MDKRLINKIINNYLIHLIQEKYNIKNAYIFGSYANGNFHQYSDIDLAIVLDNVNDIFETQVKFLNLRRNEYETMIEPHPFIENEFNYSNPFANEILKTGKKINISKLLNNNK